MLNQETIERKVASLRSKPQHVRERILLVSLAVIVPILFTIWIAQIQSGGSFSVSSGQGQMGTVGEIGQFFHNIFGSVTSSSLPIDATPSNTTPLQPASSTQ